MKLPTPILLLLLPIISALPNPTTPISLRAVEEPGTNIEKRADAPKGNIGTECGAFMLVNKLTATGDKDWNLGMTCQKSDDKNVVTQVSNLWVGLDKMIRNDKGKMAWTDKSKTDDKGGFGKDCTDCALYPWDGPLKMYCRCKQDKDKFLVGDGIDLGANIVYKDGKLARA